MIYGEEGQVWFYDPDAGLERTSEREYVTIQVRMDIRPWGEGRKTGYYDPLNGLLTFDVGAYEKWIDGLEVAVSTTRRP